VVPNEFQLFTDFLFEFVVYFHFTKCLFNNLEIYDLVLFFFVDDCVTFTFDLLNLTLKKISDRSHIT
jgi:hypothetical protein